MAINGEISIFRLTTSGQTETAVSDKVEFNGDAVIPDALSFIQDIRPIMSLIGQENETPGSNNPSNLDETGLAFTGLEINGYFRGNTATQPTGINSIKNWLKQGNQKSSDFPEGRFGFRNDINDDFDLVPSSTSGYLLESFELIYKYPERIHYFVIKLRFQGDITDL
jgi:hypothetical protein